MPRFPGLRTSLAGSVVAQGEKTVGNGTVQLVTSSTPCTRIWIGAPTASHTKGATNTGRILVGSESGGNLSGGIPIETSDSAGQWIPIEDASKIYLTGFNADDAVEYQIVK